MRDYGKGVWMHFMCKGASCGKLRKIRVIAGQKQTTLCTACGATYDVSISDKVSSVQR